MRLATFNWEDWSEADDLDVSHFGRTVGTSTGFQDTDEAGVGLDHRMDEDWLVQAGASLDAVFFVLGVPLNQSASRGGPSIALTLFVGSKPIAFGRQVARAEPR